MFGCVWTGTGKEVLLSFELSQIGMSIIENQWMWNGIIRIVVSVVFYVVCEIERWFLTDFFSTDKSGRNAIGLGDQLINIGTKWAGTDVAEEQYSSISYFCCKLLRETKGNWFPAMFPTPIFAFVGIFCNKRKIEQMLNFYQSTRWKKSDYIRYYKISIRFFCIKIKIKIIIDWNLRKSRSAWLLMKNNPPNQVSFWFQTKTIWF